MTAAAAHIGTGAARRRAFARARALLALVVLVAIGLTAALLVWRAAAADLERVTQSGLARVSQARDHAELRNALAEWHRANASVLNRRRDEWINHTLDKYALNQPHVRRLIAHVAGVDYEDRADDWKRWRSTRKKLADEAQPSVPMRERVELVERWRTAVGLTTFFSTIVCVDGAIFVPSLGAAFDDAADTADGIVRIDGRSGEAQFIFEAPDKGPRDILGIVFADGALMAACRNGFVYGVSPDGKLRWKAPTGAKLASAPLALDANRDGAADVAVVTMNGRVCVFSGKDGRSLWTTTIDLAPRGHDFDAGANSPEQAALRATLSLGALPPSGASALIVTTASGIVHALAASGGKALWRQSLDVGALGGTTCVSAKPGGMATWFAGDLGGRAWMTRSTERSFELAIRWELDHPVDWRLLAPVRTSETIGPVAAVIACTVGDPRGLGGAIFKLSPSGHNWRFTPGGAIWAAPAIADVNGDGKSEVICASSGVSESGQWWSWLSVISGEGHLLRQAWIDGAVECPPIIADVDGDGTLEILLSDRRGLLRCIATNRAGPVEWGSIGGDTRNSRNAGDAYSFGQSPFGHQAGWKPR